VASHAIKYAPEHCKSFGSSVGTAMDVLIVKRTSGQVIRGEELYFILNVLSGSNRSPVARVRCYVPEDTALGKTKALWVNGS
jgi:hypothetical protein